MDITVRMLERTDKQGWLDLWQGYHAHYQEQVSANLTFSTFDRLVDGDNALQGRIAVDADERIVGFVHYTLHESTWYTREVCFVEDLFVATDCRRQGVGRLLADEVARQAAIHVWSRVYMAVPGTDEGALAFFNTVADETDWVVFDRRL